MTQEAIHQVAQKDTPQNVEVPNTMPGLLVWAFTRFGTNLTIAMICLIAVSAAAQTVYDDLKSSNQTVIQVVRDQATINQNLSRALEGLATQVENNTRAITDTQREAQFHHRSKTAQ